jgi:hypothetical protein
LGSNVVSELLGLFKWDGAVVFPRRLYCATLSPIRSRWPARRAVHHVLKFFTGRNCDAQTASPIAMAGMIRRSIHHFVNFDGCGVVSLAEDGGGADKDGARAAICGALLVGVAGIDTVETTFGVVSTTSVVWGGTGGAGCDLSLGSRRVTTGGDDCLLHCNRSLERPGLP